MSYKTPELFETLSNITNYIHGKGVRYTYWYLTEICYCAPRRAIYLIILAY